MINLTVESVVENVDDVVGRRGLGGESRFVLLHHSFLVFLKTLDVVDVGDGLVGSVGDNLSGDGRVHAGHLQVNTDVGVVDINDVGSTQVGNILVVTDGVGSRGKGSKSSDGGSVRQEVATIGSKLSGGSDSSVGGNEASDGAIQEDIRSRICENRGK